MTGAAQDSQGNFYVSEYGEYDRIQKFAPDGRFLLPMGRPRRRAGPVRPPAENRLRRQTSISGSPTPAITASRSSIREGKLLRSGARRAARPGELYYPYDLVLAPDGNVLRLRVRQPSRAEVHPRRPLAGLLGARRPRAEGELYNPWALVRDSQGTDLRVGYEQPPGASVKWMMRWRGIDAARGFAHTNSTTMPSSTSPFNRLVSAALGACLALVVQLSPPGRAGPRAAVGWPCCCARWWSVLLVLAAGRRADGAHQRPADGHLPAGPVAEHPARAARGDDQVRQRRGPRASPRQGRSGGRDRLRPRGGHRSPALRRRPADGQLDRKPVRSASTRTSPPP